MKLSRDNLDELSECKILIELSSSTFSSNKSGSISRSEAVQILKKSSNQTMKPIATVKPMPRNENNGNSDLLGDILSRQNEFLKPTNTSTIVPKEPKKLSGSTSEKVRIGFMSTTRLFRAECEF